MKPTWCAACTEESTVLTPRPLGRNGGTVLLCPDCDPGDVKPTKRRGKPVYRGYDVPDKDPGRGSTRERFRAAANRVAPVAVTVTRSRWSGGKASPGFVIVPVLRQQQGRLLDRREALDTLSGESWFGELRHIGSDARFHVFERPDVDLARRVRGESNVDPIAALKRAIGKEKR